eukprot:4750719-Pyramimonas_sp.AAC.1
MRTIVSVRRSNRTQIHPPACGGAGAALCVPIRPRGEGLRQRAALACVKRACIHVYSARPREAGPPSCPAQGHVPCRPPRSGRFPSPFSTRRFDVVRLAYFAGAGAAVGGHSEGAGAAGGGHGEGVWAGGVALPRRALRRPLCHPGPGC